LELLRLSVQIASSPELVVEAWESPSRAIRLTLASKKSTYGLDLAEENEGETHTLDSAVNSVWGTTPFSTPEEITLQLVSQQNLRGMLKHCILVLKAAPNQLQAVIQELEEVGADDLLRTILAELHLPASYEHNPHMSQHKDHAHKKLRSCLQQQSTNLTVMIALRLTLCTQRSVDSQDYVTDLQTLAQSDLSSEEVRKGLHNLVTEGLLNWQGEETVRFSSAQQKRLSRFYAAEE
jgi:hypothetical protein